MNTTRANTMESHRKVDGAVVAGVKDCEELVKNCAMLLGARVQVHHDAAVTGLTSITVPG